MNKKRDISTRSNAPPFNSRLTPIRNELGQYIRKEEASCGRNYNAPNTLMGHLERVASHAVRLALKEGDRKSTRLNSSHIPLSRMPSSA